MYQHRLTFKTKGWLGFGGKFGVQWNRIYVSAYPEDMTPEVKMWLARTNHRLQKFYFSMA